MRIDDVFTAKMLNALLKSRGIDTDTYYFGICIREETEHSRCLRKDFTFTNCHIGLYERTFLGGTRIEKIIDTPLITDSDYELVDCAITSLERDILNGKYDDLKSEPETLNSLYENKMTTTYFKKAYADVPHIEEYIEVLIDASIPLRDIDTCLEVIKYNYDPLFIRAKVGEDIANKLYKIKGGE